MIRKGWEIRKAILDQERAQYLLSGDLTNCPTLFHTYRTRLFRVFRPHATLNHTQRFGDYLQKALRVPMNKTHQDLFKQTFKEIDKRYRNRTYLTELEAKFVWRRMVWAFYRLQKEINPKDSKVLGLNIRAIRGFSEFGNGPWSEHPELRTTVFRPGTFNYKTAERKWFFHGNMVVLGAVQIAKNETLVRLAGVGTGSADYKFPVKFDGLKEYLSDYPQLDVPSRGRKINIYSYSW